MSKRRWGSPASKIGAAVVGVSAAVCAIGVTAANVLDSTLVGLFDRSRQTAVIPTPPCDFSDAKFDEDVRRSQQFVNGGADYGDQLIETPELTAAARIEGDQLQLSVRSKSGRDVPVTAAVLFGGVSKSGEQNNLLREDKFTPASDEELSVHAFTLGNIQQMCETDGVEINMVQITAKTGNPADPEDRWTVLVAGGGSTNKWRFESFNPSERDLNSPPIDPQSKEVKQVRKGLNLL